MSNWSDLPFTYGLHLPDVVPAPHDHHIKRTLASMKGFFCDASAYERLLAEDDVLLYEVYEIKRPAQASELQSGISIVHPGKVGDEFFMTKGHFHEVLATAEIYWCLQGQGCMVMENPQGDWAVEDLRPGRVLYIPPCWAHRSVNTGCDVDLVTYFVYPGNAGHDYATIAEQGFRKLVVDSPAGPRVIDNPRWKTNQIP